MFIIFNIFKAEGNNKPQFKYKGPKEVEDLVISLYDYTSQRSDELDLCKGDEILVLVRENENWWMGELVKSKQQGYFPANYVQDVSLFNDMNTKYLNTQPSNLSFDKMILLL